MIKDREAVGRHVCPDESYVPPRDLLRAMGTVENVPVLGISRPKFRELFLRCSTCNQVYIRRKFDSHSCADAVVIYSTN